MWRRDRNWVQHSDANAMHFNLEIAITEDIWAELRVQRHPRPNAAESSHSRE